jgi:hypothetical protein
LLKGLGDPGESWLVEMFAEEHQANGQADYFGAKNRERGMARDVEGAGPSAHSVQVPGKFYKRGSQEKTHLQRPEFFLLPSPRD